MVAGLDLLLDVDRHDGDGEVLRGPARPCPSRRVAGRARGRGGRASSSALVSSSATKSRSSSVGMFGARVLVPDGVELGPVGGRLRSSSCGPSDPAPSRSPGPRRGPVDADQVGAVVPRVGDLDERPAAEAAVVVHGGNPERPRRGDLGVLVLLPLARHFDDQVQRVVGAVAVVEPDEEVGDDTGARRRRACRGS